MSPTAGIGFKADHYEEALAAPAAGLWFEVHAENYMVSGGPRLAMLDALRAERPVSLHGVGHLRRLARSATNSAALQCLRKVTAPLPRDKLI